MNMELLVFILTICSFTPRAESQGSTQNQYYNRDAVVNSDQLYFADNRPRVKQTLVRENVGNSAAQANSILQQKQVQAVTASTANGGQSWQDASLNEDGNYLKEPSTKLEPPVYGGSSTPNYYELGAQDALVSPSRTSAPNRGNANPPVRNKTDPQSARLSQSISNFGINLMKNIDQNHGRNIIVSPYSIATILALLQQGALGETQQQISRALELSPEESAAAFKLLFENIRKRGFRYNILKSANNIFISDTFDLNTNFKIIAKQNFASDITPLSFVKTNQAAQRINSWVASQTNNRIDKLVAPDSLSTNTQLVLANAVYFKGLWDIKFRPEATLPQDFHLSNGATKTAYFMRSRRFYKAGFDEETNAQIVLLPFEKEEYFLIVMLPAEDSSTDAILASLSNAKLLQYTDFLPKEVQLELPKFTVRADTNLNPVLRKMGITNIFGPLSELSGLVRGTHHYISPQVSSALHTAMLTIDEQGGTAAAATAFAVVALSNDDPSFIFTADKPFLAVLWDNKASLPLFMAKIEDPTL